LSPELIMASGPAREKNGGYCKKGDRSSLRYKGWEAQKFDQGLTTDADFKIGAAAAVNPDPASIISPSATINTISIAALTDNARATLSVDGARFAAHIVGSAIDGLLRRWLPARLTDLEIGAATAIDPNAMPIPAPCRTIGARGAAALANKANASASIDWATVAVAIIGSTIDIIVLSPAWPTRSAWTAGVADREIGAATAINPNATLIPSPSLTKGTGRATALLDELDATAGVGRTISATTIFGRAIEICTRSHALPWHRIHNGRMRKEREEKTTSKKRHKNRH
jgi:hypothetical protein